jgi:phage shock protein A
MRLMERVTALMRANLNELVDRAEDPEAMLKQVIVDMENQMIQVKTQVAIAIADEQMLLRRVEENKEKLADWMRKAELAVAKGDDRLARAALERAEGLRNVVAALEEQIADQRAETESLRNALRKLDVKLHEARARCDVLIAQHRHSRAVRRAAEAGVSSAGAGAAQTFERMRRKVQHEEAVGQATAQMAATVDEQFDALERDDRITELLDELKARRGAPRS